MMKKDLMREHHVDYVLGLEQREASVKNSFENFHSHFSSVALQCTTALIGLTNDDKGGRKSSFIF